MKTVYKPTTPIPPGHSLRELLKGRGITQKDLARELRRPHKLINEICKGKARITAHTAIQLEKFFKIPAIFWLNLESNYRLLLARKHRKNKRI